MVRLVVPVILLRALPAAVAACGGDGTSQTGTETPATAIPASPPVPPTATMAPDPTTTPAPEATAAPTQRPAPTNVPEATQTATPTETATATRAPEPTTAPPAPTEQKPLAAYAEEQANGPSAILLGDPMQLIGPPPHEGLMFQVPEAAYNQAFAASLFGVRESGIPSHLFIYTSDSYQEPIGKANLLNPTELTSSGESIEIQHTCIDRNLPMCVLIQTYWAPNVAKRTHAHALTDLIPGLGGEPVFIPPGGHYLAVQNGTVDVGTTGALLAVAGRLHEVTDYMTGPVSGFGYANNVINGDFWNKIPPDLQQIIIEEGAKAELEGSRLAPFQNLVAVQINQTLGIQPIPFSEEDIKYIIGTIGQERIIPGWLERLGYPGKNEDAVRIFNEHIGEYIGLKIEADGSVKQVPITKGPQAAAQ